MQRFVFRVLATAAGGAAGERFICLLTGHLLASRSAEQPLVVAALVFALILGLLNAFLRPILLLLTLPLNLLTLGLFTLVVNAHRVLAGQPCSAAAYRWTISAAAFLGALVVSVVSFVASRVLT